MFNISDYLKKFSRIEGESTAVKDTVTSALYETCGATIDFEIKKDILYIKGSPVVKALVYTKKQQILALLRSKNGKLRISDIR